MRLQLFFGLLLCTFVKVLYGAPLVQNVHNQSQIGFEIVSHSDVSTCSLQHKKMFVDAESDFKQEFLLERGQPSLILRPVYYFDILSGSKMYFVDEFQQLDKQKLDDAFQAWKKAGYKKKFNDAQDWFNRWIGSDIEIKPHMVEVFGYLINLSRIHIYNAISQYATWLSFSKGVFSRLVLDVNIKQHKRKGLQPTLKVVAGEGGICRDGSIERLF